MVLLAHLSSSKRSMLTLSLDLITGIRSQLSAFFWLLCMIYGFFHHEQIFLCSSRFPHLDAVFRVLNWTEEEGAVDQRISIVHQHHFLAGDARHVSLLVGGEG
jgi:hypothetical protein